jgi:cytochrome c oxidase cbb3-type subunit 3
MKKTFFFVIGSFTTLSAWAQEATKEKRFWDDPFNHPLLPLYSLVSFIFVIILLVIVVSIVLIRTMNLLIEQMEKQRAEKLGQVYVPETSWLEKLWDKLNAAVPVSQEKDIELDHNYDGIKELDNHLPPWWKWLFYLSIIWAIVYIGVYHFSNSLPLSREEYENEVAQATAAQQIFLASQPKAVIDESALVYSPDPAIIEKGKAVFTKNNCGSCHRSDGGGNAIGPNLTDEYWLHGGVIKNVFNTIKNGVVEKGMPAWGKSMSPADVRDVTFFVLSLQGSNPANAKAPQGELTKPEAKTEKPDSTKIQAALK